MSYFPKLLKLSYKPDDRAGRMRLLCLCWTGFLLTFFTFSTTQEYYSMPCYPALALLLGSAMVAEDRMSRIGSRVLAVVSLLAATAVGAIFFLVRNLPTPGDISSALTQNPDAYTLSLGHMGDLTLESFAYLRLPLLIAGVAFLIGAWGAWRFRRVSRALALAAMMTLFFHAARLALIAFDPYLASRPLAEALMQQPAGQLIVDDQYYTFSSVFFYTNQRALLLNGRVNNLEYGSYAPGAPQVFIGDEDFAARWRSGERYYLVIEKQKLSHIEDLVGAAAIHIKKESGGKLLAGNQ